MVSEMEKERGWLIKYLKSLLKTMPSSSAELQYRHTEVAHARILSQGLRDRQRVS